MELIFYDSVHYLNPIVNDNHNGNRQQQDFANTSTHDNETTAASLKVLGQPLIVRNINQAAKLIKIDNIKISDKFPKIIQLVHDSFPSIDTQVLSGNDADGGDNYTGSTPSPINSNNDTNSNNNNNNNKSMIIASDEVEVARGNNNNNNNNNKRRTNRITLPINSIIYYSADSSNKNDKNDNDNNNGNDDNNNKGLLTIDPVVYPWDFLNAVKKVLSDEVTQKTISPTAKIAQSSIIEGPCIIEDNVTIDDFCKIKGPVYIGNGSFIGTGSLIRNCMIGNNTKIGFNSEISNSYFKGHDVTAHLNIIGESVIGENVWFAGYSTVTYLSLTKQNIKYEIGGGKSVDTGTFRFGALIGDNCKIGTSVVILPGRQVPANTEIKPETIFTKVPGVH